MALFLVVLDYPSITDPAQKVALLVEKQMVIFATNLLQQREVVHGRIFTVGVLRRQQRRCVPDCASAGRATHRGWSRCR